MPMPRQGAILGQLGLFPGIPRELPAETKESTVGHRCAGPLLSYADAGVAASTPPIEPSHFQGKPPSLDPVCPETADAYKWLEGQRAPSRLQRRS